MYKDNSLIPTEAVRLAALGTLQEGPRRYADLAAEVRGFVGHIVGPSLDLIGPPMELLRVEGLDRGRRRRRCRCRAAHHRAPAWRN